MERTTPFAVPSRTCVSEGLGPKSKEKCRKVISSFWRSCNFFDFRVPVIVTLRVTIQSLRSGRAQDPDSTRRDGAAREWQRRGGSQSLRENRRAAGEIEEKREERRETRAERRETTVERGEVQKETNAREKRERREKQREQRGSGPGGQTVPNWPWGFQNEAPKLPKPPQESSWTPEGALRALRG